MAKISILDPASHFNGKKRLLAELIGCLDQANLGDFRLAVAFAKVAPIVKLGPALDAWRKKGKTTQAIIGLSHKGTSQQALELALNSFDEVFVCYPGSAASFHPKIYLFSGAESGTLFYGSHNLTVGGTETNFEAGIRVDLSLPADQDLLNAARSSLDQLLPINCPATRKLDTALLAELIDKDFVFDETIPSKGFSAPTTEGKTAAPKLFPTVFPKAPMTVPTGSLEKAVAKSAEVAAEIPASAPLSPSESLAIQIVPHHNGEIFLSKKAINQNPVFFGFPFSGETVPKKGENESYPQRDPDPIVDISIFDHTGKLVFQRFGYHLNTVFYEKKGEIRITVSPDIREEISNFSILHMRTGDNSCDYYFDIYNPGSKKYDDLLAACDQVLPSGGAPVARRMGWL